ncbi:response regulator [Candidatus Parcubacteria bacterium]|nr:MAG: response regulator [Candidatus Parcubacteria bacterium]
MPEAQKPKLILIIDDDANFREIFSLKLGEAGFRVETAHDGKEGLEKIEQLHPDLVLMDVNMPKLNGVEALLEMRAEPKIKDTRVLFLTALGDPRSEMREINRRLSKEVGAVGYIRKEQDLEKTVAYIKSFLEGEELLSD